ncbi:hypothetical protein PG994_009391 [Apiospora phragmitis]|uniref:GH16 domain-containing protein n=1 Tax=Apiospora phragmitis TaxID=2905665 RepID=A0ABR1UJ62_9PEZI
MVIRHMRIFRPLAATSVVSWVPLLLPLFLLHPLPTAADCECGYSTTSSGAADIVFSELLESDFTRVDYFGHDYTGPPRWARQAYAKSASTARGPFGEAFVTGNAISDTATTTTKHYSKTSNNDDGGLQLVVGSKVVDGMVQNAEIATTGLDYFYGTYRVGLKVTDVPGTCTAVFWYFNDTQEIDIEFLSHEFNHANKLYPVNLVLQTAQSRAAGYDASGVGTGTFQKRALPFDPTAGFHEYRLDFLADRVVFYADGAALATMTGWDGGIPSVGGHLLLSHWSNGNPGWSAGPPRGRAAYYNSSDAARGGDARSRCETVPAGGSSSKVCTIPEGDPNFFFSDPGSGGDGGQGSGGSGNGGGTGTGANGPGNGNGGGHHNAASPPVAMGRLGPLAQTVALGAAVWVVGL